MASRRTPSLTSLPRAPRDEESARVRHYIVTMGIRVVCFILMVAVTPYGWYTWVFGIAAAVLPYFAVVIANAGSDNKEPTAESPQMQLAPPSQEPVAPPAEQPRTITLHESRPLLDAQNDSAEGDDESSRE
ncbi:DUF3099 domain-containing protein [Microbacterium keratanolyticum]|uniref:DUF3099 domain-containing protein n=1 Tax=Microbacterium keratanolyticum TaxID=67574 RepID=UPI00363A6694